MKGSVELRKGAWSEEEDLRLRKCVETYGEGQWHQVPLRAGLNRCRKSCRLRWLNYLKPDINRGQFKDDEVDLIVRLHKLLGNRWSLIAGRLPGRTSNDIKNYWNTHISKKTASDQRKKIVFDKRKKANKKTHERTQTTVIKPQARSLTKRLFSSWETRGTTLTTDIHLDDDLIEQPSWLLPEENSVWQSSEGGNNVSCTRVDQEISSAAMLADVSAELGENCWNGVSIDMENLWDILDSF